MDSKKMIIFMFTLFYLITIFTSCTQKTNNPETENTVEIESTEVKGDIFFDTTTLYGDSITEEDLDQNILTIVNIWGTWCPPCVRELPYLQEISEYYSDKDVEIVGVLQDGVNDRLEIDEAVVSDAKKLLDNAKVTYKNILPDSQIHHDYINVMQSYPTTFFFDSERNLIKIIVGAKSVEDWKEIIDEVLENFQ